MKASSIRTFNDSLLISLALLSVGLLIFEITSNVTPETLALIRNIDLGIALIFGLEFLTRLLQAKNKRTFMRHNWWHILASIPITASGTQALRGLMLIRLYRILRVTSVVARFSLFSKSFRNILKKTHMAWIGSLLAIVFSLGSVLFYYFEHIENPYVNDLYDAFWFMTETMTNTGIGEVYPMTSGGRLIGMLSMFFGTLIFGLFVAFIASYLVESRAKKKN